MLITTIKQRIATAAIKGAWATISTGERLSGLGERMEAWAQRLASRWGCDDDALAAIAADTMIR